MKQLYTIAILTWFSLAAFGQAEYTMPMNFENTARDFVVHIPTGYTAGMHLPVVFNLHGLGSDGPQQIFYSKMAPVADQNQFIAVFPNGLANSWNAGFTGAYHGTSPNDVGFISKIIDTLFTLYSIDLTRVYACGMSNGGFESYRLACDLENRIAAIASVTGTMSDSIVHYCTQSRNVPIMEIHGTADPLVPYNGQAGGIWAIEDAMNFWRNKNQCVNTPDTSYVPNTNTTDSSTIMKIHYGGCSSGVEVLFYKVIGGGHSWPNGAIDYIYGPTNRDINGSQEIWNFFKKYTLNGPVGVEDVKRESIEVEIYPNPANDVVKIEAAENIQTVIVYNILGEKVLQHKVAATVTELNLMVLINGIYLVEVEGPGFKQVKRVVKQ